MQELWNPELELYLLIVGFFLLLGQIVFFFSKI